MSTIQAVLIAILQGATELFPVSSLGHAVLLPALVGWTNIDQHAPSFLPFLVMLHVGTATALLAYFWRDWWTIGTGVLGMGGTHQVSESRRVLILVVIATIPAVIAGFVAEKFFRSLFGTPVVAAVFLIVNAGLLVLGERLRGREAETGAERTLASLTPADALVIGLWQCTALIPGISRSGATIVGGLLRGVDHAGSAHFSFLIATPIILGATVLEVPKLLHANVAPGAFQQAAIAAVVAGVVALASTAFLMRYFRHNDRMALRPFAIYCVLAGAISLAVLLAA